MDDVGARRVLLIIEDETLAELVDEALREAGHVVARLDDDGDLEATLAARPLDVVIVDLDTRARTGGQLVARLRRWSPATTVVALLPCGGLPAGARVPYHLAVEKPARLRALLTAVDAAQRGRGEP